MATKRSASGGILCCSRVRLPSTAGTALARPLDGMPCGAPTTQANSCWPIGGIATR